MLTCVYAMIKFGWLMPVAVLVSVTMSLIRRRVHPAPLIRGHPSHGKKSRVSTRDGAGAALRLQGAE